MECVQEFGEEFIVKVFRVHYFTCFQHVSQGIFRRENFSKIQCMQKRFSI